MLKMMLIQKQPVPPMEVSLELSLEVSLELSQDISLDYSVTFPLDYSNCELYEPYGEASWLLLHAELYELYGEARWLLLHAELYELMEKPDGSYCMMFIVAFF